MTVSETGRVMIVAAPGDEIETSGIVRLEPDGTPHRDYEPVGYDGIAVLQDAPVASQDRAVRYRVTRGNAQFTGTPDSYPHSFPQHIELVRVHPAPPPAPGDRAAIAAIDDLFGRTGISAGSVRSFTVLWAGDLDGPDGESERLTVLAVELPDGPYYVIGVVGGNAPGQRTTSSCGSEILPSSAGVDQPVLVLRCPSSSGPGRATEGTLVVVAPPRATTGRALDARGEQIARFPLADGVAVVPFPADLASVAVSDANGETVDEGVPMGQADFGD